MMVHAYMVAINDSIANNTINCPFLQIEQVSPGFSERYLLDPQRFQSELTEYKEYVKSMMQLAGAGNSSLDFAEEILDFSTKIAKVSKRG